MPYSDRATQNRFNLEWQRARRAEWIAENGPCANCGFWTDDLETDHVDPEQKVSHRVWSWTKARRDEELKKCQVLCRLCHQIKTNRERREGVKADLSAIVRRFGFTQVDPQVNLEGRTDVA